MNGRKFEQSKTEIRRKSQEEQLPRRRKRRRKSGVGKAILFFTVLLALAVGVVLSLTVFFKIKSIDVYGESIYPSSDITEAGKIKLDSNLIRLDSKSVSSRISTVLPYVDSVTVKKKIPNTVELYITPVKVAGYVKSTGGYDIVSTSGKVLEKGVDKPVDACEIIGIETSETELSKNPEDTDGKIECLNMIYTALGRGITSELTRLDVSDTMGMTFVYRDRITVKLGSRLNLSEKIKFVVSVMLDENKVNPDDIGVIHAESAKRISFLREGSYKEKKAAESQTEEQTESTEETDSDSDRSSEKNSDEEKPQGTV